MARTLGLIPSTLRGRGVVEGGVGEERRGAASIMLRLVSSRHTTESRCLDVCAEGPFFHATKLLHQTRHVGDLPLAAVLGMFPLYRLEIHAQLSLHRVCRVSCC